jgi:hypothetical protein
LGLFLDHRLINGDLAWIKPCKFSLSFAVYGLTLNWFSQYLTRNRKFFQITCKAALCGAVVELLAIMLQVVRGTTSHFNTATAFDHIVFCIITVAILPVAFSSISLLFILMREKKLPPVLGLSMKWGIFIALIGFVPGILMLVPESVRQLIYSNKQLSDQLLANSSPVLPFLGWSTVSGDLRVAHFVGIHALQILPIFGLLIEKLSPNQLLSTKKLLVFNGGFTYLACVCLLTLQALCAESFAMPSSRTILSFAIIGAMSLLGLLFTLFCARAELMSAEPSRA